MLNDFNLKILKYEKFLVNVLKYIILNYPRHY